MLPGLARRPEDIEPNVDHLLARVAEEAGRAVRFSAGAKARYLQFARSPEATWNGNFRDLSASVTRMATLADGGGFPPPWSMRRSSACGGSGSLRGSCAMHRQGGSAADLGGRGERPYADLDQELDRLLPAGMARTLDLFDRLQLEAVVRVCRECATLSEAGRRLFDQSRTQRSVVNDADRLRKYLLKFGLEWEAVRG